uniref:Ribonuclease P/MRP protein subunit POP5 n=1 Tax=Anopheles atroparvus TaxID=41427 RepID=A0A182J4T4_ANOAO
MVRVKNRYILVQLRSNDKPEEEELFVTSRPICKYLEHQLEKYYGTFGAASMLRLYVIYFNAKTHLCIIQCSHGPHRFITSILPLLTTADTESARFRTLYVGATLRQCHKFIVKYQQRYINKTIGNYRGNMQKKKLVEAVTKVVKM